jgi:glycosyltransferase involved in cell wall biosynthesis
VSATFITTTADRSPVDPTVTDAINALAHPLRDVVLLRDVGGLSARTHDTYGLGNIRRTLAIATHLSQAIDDASYIEDTFGVPASRVHVVPCGIDTAWFTPAPETAGDAPIVCVAGLNPVKQLDVLIRACGMRRDRQVAFTCAIVGDGPERSALESLRGELDLNGAVALMGAVEQTEVRDWWRRASVAVLSSRSEGMPVCLMEAAACGVAAVAPDVGGIGELIEDGVTGIVTPPNDPVALANALQRLLSDADLRGSMRVAARRRAEARFSRRRQIDSLSAIWAAVN